LENSIRLAGCARGDESGGTGEARIVAVVAVSVQIVHVEADLADALILVGQDGVGLARQTVVIVGSIAASAAGIAT